jgi:CRP-like cAMP-binding protein
MIKTRTARSILTVLPLFRELSEEEKEQLFAGVREIRLAKGQMLFNKGDLPTGFYVLAEGSIQLAFPSEQGCERVLEIIKPFESFGEALMFLEKPYPIFSQALQNSVVFFISANTIFSLLDNDTKLARKMLAGISKRLHELVTTLEACSMKSSTHRIACMLYHMGHKAGINEFVVELPAAKHLLASQLNLTPETFSRVLHVLTEAGLIEVSGRNIKVLDAEGLRTLKM